MPTVAVSRSELFNGIDQGEPLHDDSFEHLCFEFGIELDDVICELELPAGVKGKGDLLVTGPDGRTITTKVDSAMEAGQIVEVELLMGCCNRGETLQCEFVGKKWSVTDPTVIYKIDVPANRSDLLCHEGLVLSLRVFRGIMPTPVFGGLATPRDSMLKMSVAPQTGLIRPHVVCAVLRGVSLDQARFDSFIKLQEKLHFNIARRRSLVAIGTHDLDKVSAPFTYEALPPTDISFVPLKQTEVFTAAELMELYLDTTKMAGKQLREYVPLIYDSPVYPVIYDAERTVLSLPPVINGSVSAVSVATKNIFIECTAVDRTKADVVLSTLVCLFSQYCDAPFSVEQVEVTYEATGKVEVTPNLASWQSEASLDYINTLVGERLSADTVCSLLERMQLSAAYDGARGKVVVQVPPTRSDILHACDIAEDVAIAYGYNKIRVQLPQVCAAGEPQPVGLLTELLRVEIAALGFSEVLALGLCSHDENFAHFRTAEVDGTRAVVLDNPKVSVLYVYRYILRESCSQFDSLPLTSLTIQDPRV
jgi:phenylalanyl-tRNA synthetase beta chain